ncbi:MAG: hypothetical protein FJX65_05420 [Alphaproteobacteria bacterium]|nr:hypothetical protein [Alphaproteobacteria bacterium]
MAKARKKTNGTKAKSNGGQPVRLPIHAKGKRAGFYRDPANDQIFSFIIMLTQELSVAMDRIETIERLLDKNGVVRRKDIEAYRPGDAEETERTARRDAYIGRVFQILHEEAEKLEAGH